MEKLAELIFIPNPGLGHLVSTIEFAKKLIQHDHQLLITLLVIKLPVTPYVDAYIKSLTHSEPNIRILDIPLLDPPPLQLLKKSLEAYIYATIKIHEPHIKSIVAGIMSSRSDSIPVVGMVLDFFYVSLVDIGHEFGIPSFIFMTSGAGFLNLMLSLPSRHQQIASEFSFSDPQLSIPGFSNLVPPRFLPGALLNKYGGYNAYVEIAKRFKEVKGIIVNTFIKLEPYAIKSYNNGKNPKIYPVGPVLNLKNHPHPEMDNAEWEKIMKWLDNQPESSVVFLCFGSAGGFDEGQVKEIAFGLEQNGQKFLWSMRVYLTVQNVDSKSKTVDEMLPEGFLERVRGRGIVCGWAPQTEVLAHKAIGGFVSHCGWNSILESLWYGVPIATLPIYAEQQFNAFTMVKELGLGVELKSDYRVDGDLKMAEVEKAVRCLMDSDCEVRKKVKDMAEMARMGCMENGSSFTSISQFITDLRGNNY